MNRIATLAVAAGMVCVSACASAPPAEPAAVDPLRDFYDVAWIGSADGSVRTLQQVADELSAYDVVFFGEFHRHPGNHLAQMQLFEALHRRHADMTLSLEQFERDTQPLVDQYLAGEIGERVLIEEGRGWPNYTQSYRPLVEYARDNGLPVLAANAPKDIVVCVGRKGAELLDEIPEPDRSWVAAELHLDDGAYKDKYFAQIGNSYSHGGVQKDEDEEEVEPEELSPQMRAMLMKSFSAQVTRDDTMAESIAMHLGENPGRKVMHLDGHFHSASHLGTVERLKMRMPDLKVAVVNPIAVEDKDAPAWTDEDAATGDFLLLIREMPESFVDKDREYEFQRDVLKKRMDYECNYGAQAAPEGK